MSHRIATIATKLSLFGALCAVSGTVHAASYRWVGPDNGSWNTPSNWLPSGVPASMDSVFIGTKHSVSVSEGATVANLTLGAGAELKNGGQLKVTGKTSSAGLFTGLGSLTVPAGATAVFTVDGSTTRGQISRLRGCSLPSFQGAAAPVVFASIVNKGHVTTRVAKGSRADFASIQNTGSLDVVADGAISFHNIQNSRDLVINVSGTLSLGKVENLPGASLSISAARARGHFTSVSLGAKDGKVPLVAVQLDELTNRRGANAKLSGDVGGRVFQGKSIRNEGVLQMSGAQTLLEADVTNAAGATLLLDNDTRIFPADASAPRLLNAGRLVKSAGSDSTLSVEWNNSGQTIIENGTLHVRAPTGKACKQTGGTTTLEGGTLSVEEASGASSSGTYDVQGGVFDGIGTLNGNLTNSGGHLRPGHSPGSITINGNFVQTAGGVLDMEIGGTTPGVSYDQILVNGTAYLGGLLDVIRWGGYVPQRGGIYILFTYYARSGNFNQVVDTLPLQGVSYDTTLTSTDLELNCYVTTPVDASAPTATIVSPANGAGVLTATNATGTASDNVGVTRVTGRLYCYANPVTGVPAGFWAGGPNWTVNATAANEVPATGTSNWNFAFPALSPGRYSVRATAYDAAGNSASSTTIAFWLDPNAPSMLTISAPLNGSAISALPSVAGTASDAADGCGLLSVRGQLRRTSDGFSWNGSAWINSTFTFTTNLSGINYSRTLNLPTGANLPPGAYAFIASAADKAGNTRTLTSNFTVVAPANSDSGGKG